VQSLAHPGGNITGFSMLLTEMAAKELEILHEALPGAARIGFVTPGEALTSMSLAAFLSNIRYVEHSRTAQPRAQRGGSILHTSPNGIGGTSSVEAS
jgi:hypothetical protein